MRTCSGCRRRRRQDELLRVAHHPDGSIAADPEGVRRAGRGSYVCAAADCVRRALTTGGLQRGLRAAPGDMPVRIEQELLDRIE